LHTSADWRAQGVWEDEAASIERKEALVRDVAEQLVSLRILA
jgi:hypothetical protein